MKAFTLAAALLAATASTPVAADELGSVRGEPNNGYSESTRDYIQYLRQRDGRIDRILRRADIRLQRAREANAEADALENEAQRARSVADRKRVRLAALTRNPVRVLAGLDREQINELEDEMSEATALASNLGARATAKRSEARRWEGRAKSMEARVSRLRRSTGGL